LPKVTYIYSQQQQPTKETIESGEIVLYICVCMFVHILWVGVAAAAAIMFSIYIQFYTFEPSIVHLCGGLISCMLFVKTNNSINNDRKTKF
jgi:hypothetical protein